MRVREEREGRGDEQENALSRETARSPKLDGVLHTSVALAGAKRRVGTSDGGKGTAVSIRDEVSSEVC